MTRYHDHVQQFNNLADPLPFRIMFTNGFLAWLHVCTSHGMSCHALVYKNVPQKML